MTIREVELRHAYVWTCDECGRDNFHNGLTLDPSQWTPEELAAKRKEFGIEPGEECEWMWRPDTVVCEFCGAEFRVESPEEIE